jgi:cell division protein FtsB
VAEWPPTPRPKPKAPAPKAGAKAAPAARATAKPKATTRRTASPRATTTPKTKRRAKRTVDTGRRKATARAALGSVVLVGLLFAFVYPTRTFLDQRADTGKARAQLELLRSENAKLARDAQKLQSDTEIERRARAYGLVKPGEQPFVIIPAPSTVPPVTTPPGGTPQAAP